MLVDIYKIVIRNKKTKRQLLRKVYFSEERFTKCGYDIFKRYTLASWSKGEFIAEIYQLNDKQEWVRIQDFTEED